METYLAIMTTVLVLTQIIRLIQNTIQLRRQSRVFEGKLKQVEEITQEDIERQRYMHEMVIKYIASKGVYVRRE